METVFANGLGDNQWEPTFMLQGFILLFIDGMTAIFFNPYILTIQKLI